MLPPLVGFVLNLYRGPTCKCHLHTAVQDEDLVALRRWRRAQRVAASLKPLIEAAQGRLTPDDFEGGPDGAPPLR
ncbi:MAG TPA: hypothetical protein ENN80_02730, partial [Candidatus Hydrogenedentes bacterium]|nr:hypothetical protein [Candidatus Hydrogenedentota bacterium]